MVSDVQLGGWFGFRGVLGVSAWESTSVAAGAATLSPLRVSCSYLGQTDKDHHLVVPR